jgi:serine/threonine protein kinase
VVKPTSVEFLVHMSLAAGVASVNSLAEEGLEHRSGILDRDHKVNSGNLMSRSEHIPTTAKNGEKQTVRHRHAEKVSVTGAPLDLQWRQLANVEYLTDGGNSWIHTAVYNGKPVVIKTLKPECQDVVLAINEIESELAIHSRLSHVNIVSLVGAGTTSKGVRFFVLERLDGGTLSQRLGYDNRIRDRRKRFWRKRLFSFLDVLRIGKAIAEAMSYCHEKAIPGCVVLHRDLKPDNIGTPHLGTFHDTYDYISYHCCDFQLQGLL